MKYQIKCAWIEIAKTRNIQLSTFNNRKTLL